MTEEGRATDVRVQLYFNYANFPLPGERDCPATADDLRRHGMSTAIRDAYQVPPDLVIRELAPLQKYRARWPVVTGEAISLWHNTCLHRQYNLSCERYEQLLAEANYACQRCGQPNEKLHIDHDHALGWWAVRGVVDPWCNSQLARVDNGVHPCDPLSRRYLDNPPSWRKPFERAPFHAFTTLVGMWEHKHRIPRHQRIGYASQYGMNAAIRRINRRVAAGGTR